MDKDRVKIEAELNQLQSEMNGCKTEMGLNSSNSQLNKKTIHQCNNQIQLQEEVIYQKVSSVYIIDISFQNSKFKFQNRQNWSKFLYFLIQHK